jgi:hypothetical protein
MINFAPRLRGRILGKKLHFSTSKQTRMAKTKLVDKQLHDQWRPLMMIHSQPFVLGPAFHLQLKGKMQWQKKVRTLCRSISCGGYIIVYSKKQEKTRSNGYLRHFWRLNCSHLFSSWEQIEREKVPIWGSMSSSPTFWLCWKLKKESR